MCWIGRSGGWKKIDDTYSKEEIYLQILKDIYDSCINTLTDEELAQRFEELPKTDFKQSVINLKKYMEAVSELYGIRLWVKQQNKK